MGNKIVSTCIPTIENRIDSYNLEQESKNNKSLITIENSLAYLDESQIYEHFFSSTGILLVPFPR